MLTKRIYYFVVIVTVLSLVKVDYRFQDIPFGLEVDDAEYYYTAYTIGVDFDLDFSNQMAGVENRYLNIETRKIVPFHPIGSGILASPFVFIGNIFSSFSLDENLSFQYFFYSISTIFYLFLTIIFLKNSLKKLNINFENKLLILLIFGTGIAYYAFDRFSMSHIYEIFGSSALIYMTTISLENLTLKRKNIINFSIGVLIFVFLSIRWTNYCLFFIPPIIYILKNKKIKELYFNIFYILGNLVGLVIFLIHTKYLYGIYTLNQTKIVMLVESSVQENYLRFFNTTLFFENIQFVFKSIQIILFSQEFGLFYFAPIIFISTVIILFLFLKKKYKILLLILASYIAPLFSVIVLQNTAFSYGYRYLFVLIPINILLYFKYLNNYLIVKKYMYFFSIIGFILYLFFETLQATSLSNEFVVNSFGSITRYSNPKYLSGIIDSITNFDAYLHIVFTSFFGVGLIKFADLFVDPIIFFGKYTTLNSQIIELVDNSINFSWTKLFILYIVVITLLSLVLKNKTKK